MKKVMAAIVGCGAISGVYLKSIQENFTSIEVVACSDLSEERMRKTAERYQVRAMSWQEILKEPSIEMVLNLTGPSAHYPLSKQAMEHGKHVYSEKMMAVDYQDGKRLCALADQYGVRFGCAPDTFLGGGLQTARYAADHGLAGRILSGVISLTRDYRVFGENLPHLYQRGGSILYDMGGYYFTAACSILGNVKRVSAFGKKTEEAHRVLRAGAPLYGQELAVEEENVAAAILEFEDQTLVTVHFNSGTILNETFHLEFYGEKGILRLGDPNTFGGRVTLEKAQNEPTAFPFTHGFQKESRGLGAAEMAWAIRNGRPHRAGKEMALHVLEIIHGIFISIKTQRIYEMETTFERPEPLPEGFIGEGFWEAEEESALI